ncbi:MAG: carboxymuconolactone decarboxylase family protein [Rhodospirillales bacterium]
MARVDVIDPQTATGEAKQLLAAVQSGLGIVPNFIRVLANSPAALNAFLGIHGIAGAGALDPKTRERIALAVAEQNACQYCVSAHTAIGRKVGLDNHEMLANRMGRSSDAKAEAALTFARALVEHTGQVSKAEFDAVRAAGHSDAEIIEIITHVAMNIFTNLLGKATQVEIDFPKIELNQAA